MTTIEHRDDAIIRLVEMLSHATFDLRESRHGEADLSRERTYASNQMINAQMRVKELEARVAELEGEGKDCEDTDGEFDKAIEQIAGLRLAISEATELLDGADGDLQILGTAHTCFARNQVRAAMEKLIAIQEKTEP